MSQVYVIAWDENCSQWTFPLHLSTYVTHIVVRAPHVRCTESERWSLQSPQKFVSRPPRFGAVLASAYTTLAVPH